MTAAGTRARAVWQPHAGMPASPDNVAAERFAHIDQLLGQMQDAIGLVRTLLKDVAQDESGSPGHEAALETASLAALALGEAAAGVHAHTPNHADMRFAEGQGGAMNWELLTRRLIRERFASIGHVGAGVLMRLLCAPGEFVSCEDLARSAGVRSASNRVVKVYICRLRSALGAFDLPADTIETGRRSYRLQAAAVPRIMSSLKEELVSEGG